MTDRLNDDGLIAVGKMSTSAQDDHPWQAGKAKSFACEYTTGFY